VTPGRFFGLLRAALFWVLMAVIVVALNLVYWELVGPLYRSLKP
jgi:hypothetical protein